MRKLKKKIIILSITLFLSTLFLVPQLTNAKQIGYCGAIGGGGPGYYEFFQCSSDICGGGSQHDYCLVYISTTN